MEITECLTKLCITGGSVAFTAFCAVIGAGLAFFIVSKLWE